LLDVPKLGPGTLETVSQALEQARWIAGHGVAGDITELVAAGIPVKEEWVRGDKVLCSLLLARMADENDLSYELENLALSKFDIEPWKYKTRQYDFVVEEVNGKRRKRKNVDARRWPVALRRERCAMDAWAARRLVEEFYDPKLQALIGYTHRTAMLLERVGLSGAVVDLDVLRTLDTQYRLERDQARDALVKLAGMAGVDGFSPTNDDHIRTLLFDTLKLESSAKTPSGKASVDKAVLKQLATRDGGSDAVRFLLQFNRADKLYTVNVSGVWKAMGTTHPGCDGTGYVPFRINPLGARTGRRSSSNPNAQNWPEAVRGMVRSRWPEGLILNADYKKLEVVLIAWVAGDDKLLAYFTKGRGYQDVAKELFGYEVESGTPMYTAVKSIVLGVHYNMQTPKMARQLWTLYDEKTQSYPCRLSADFEEHERVTGKLRGRYLTRFVGIGRYMEARQSSWEQTGVSSSYTGRARHLPVPERNEGGYGHMLNQAINFPIQSLASDVTASAMMDFESAMLYEAGYNYTDYLENLLEQRKYLTSSGNRGIMCPISQIFNEVHDSLVVDLYPGSSKRDQEILLDCMRSVRSLKKLAPGFDTSILDADVKIHHHWRSK
jgi:DNA polymerase I-like protein with 3'-5' exonuclease and polymerase domains